MNKIVIIGGGESGVGAALLAKHKGYDVFLSDKGVLNDKYQKTLEENQIQFESGSHSEDKILGADVVVKSPGVPNKVDLIQRIKAKGIPVISEIEFAAQFTQTPIIAITGSNGKTTTTSLIAHMMQKEGWKIGLGGNIGKSFAQLVIEDDFDYYVLEISSFQLDDIQNFKPKVALLLNITPDHLDRYNYDIQEYAQAKFRITENQDEDDFFIYNEDDKIIQDLIQNKKTHARKLGFSLKNEEAAAYADDKILTVKYPEKFSMTVEELALIGEHNKSNSLAAALNGNVLKMRKNIMRESLMDFDAVEHRLEPVLTIHGMKFINDSKATNVNATYFALQSMTTPVVWIVGGQDKGNDYAEIMPFVKKKVRAIVCLGVDNQKIKESFEGQTENIVETNNMRDAVRSAYMLGKKGDTILLSPACASFDLFDNYEHRGKLFKDEVKLL